jgi:hypothetical protein
VIGNDWLHALGQFFDHPEFGGGRRNDAEVIAMLPGHHRDVIDCATVQGLRVRFHDIAGHLPPS